MDCPVNDEVHAGKHGPEDEEQREEVDDVFLFGVPGNTRRSGVRMYSPMITYRNHR